VPAAKTSAGSKEVERLFPQTRNVSGFTSIDLNLEAQVEFTPDTAYSIEISAQPNVLKVMETGLAGSTLILGLKPWTILRNHKPITIKIHAPDIGKVRVNGSGSITILGDWNIGMATMDILGSGYISAEKIQGTQLDVHISGSGEVLVSDGMVTDVTTQITGSGNSLLRNLTAEHGHANISGSGQATMNASNTLNVGISGSGKVKYKGNPVVTLKISGSGKVEKL
jgi:hypothetical protein